MKLFEGAKVSQQLINAALTDPWFTFGFETEFFFKGFDVFMKKFMARNSNLDDSGWHTKKLSDTTWHDVIKFFDPLDVPHDAKEDNFQVLKQRLSDIAVESGGKASTPSNMFFDLVDQFSYPTIMAMLKIYPRNGFMVNDQQQNSLTAVFRRGDTNKASTLTKLENVQYRMYEEGFEAEEFNVVDSLDNREIFYEILAHQLSSAIGEPVGFANHWNHSPEAHAGNTRWAIVPDESMVAYESQNQDTIGVEIISPVKDLASGLEFMENVFDLMNNPEKLGFKGMTIITTEDTGLHINLGIRNTNLDYLKLIMLMGDTNLLQQYGRENNEQTSSTYLALVDALQQRSGKVAGLLSQFASSAPTSKQDMASIIQTLKKQIPMDKFQSVNLTKLAQGFVEFRALGNTDYHKDLAKLRQAVLSLAVWIHVAAEPSVYRKEYYSKLYKFIMEMGKSLQGGRQPAKGPLEQLQAGY